MNLFIYIYRFVYSICKFSDHTSFVESIDIKSILSTTDLVISKNKMQNDKVLLKVFIKLKVNIYFHYITFYNNFIHVNILF